ncbi:MAG: TetR/AcrR family transcriptional regulator [Burkholderiaceae bacterium]
MTKEHQSSIFLSEPGQRKPRGRGHERRDEILGAAARLFVEHGFESVSTRRIADALGISQTTLYVYFPTKDAILDALCERCFTKLVGLFRKVTEGEGEPLEKLRLLMQAYVEFGLEHSDEYRIAFMLSRHDDHTEAKNMDLPAEMQPQGIQCFLLLQEHIALIGRRGELNFEPAVVAQCLWAAGHGLVALLNTMTGFPWASKKELVAKLIEIQFHGIVRRSHN